MVFTSLGMMTGSRRVVTMGLLPPKIQCSALATVANATSVHRPERMARLEEGVESTQFDEDKDGEPLPLNRGFLNPQQR